MSWLLNLVKSVKLICLTYNRHREITCPASITKRSIWDEPMDRRTRGELGYNYVSSPGVSERGVLGGHRQNNPNFFEQSNHQEPGTRLVVSPGAGPLGVLKGEIPLQPKHTPS